MLEGKLRPQFDKVDGRPEKIAVASKADVKLREKQRDFERRDYQAQKVMIINMNLLTTGFQVVFQWALTEEFKFC